ncbi:MAG TPA: hypothetical protein VN419_10470, partial [Humidesulfovibrio sp.]|uniref:hypothetical protein n=1 Tax=Humidesulfovibrio sp. TaxID=2910988 RepID=UPI002C23D11B
MNILLLLAACGILFYRHHGALLEDQDAFGLLFQVKSSFIWRQSLLQEVWHPMSLLGTNSLLNVFLLPPFLALRAVPGLAGTILCFTVLALELFLSMYLLCRSFELEQGKSLAVAWLCVNLVLPLHQHPVPLGPVYTV